MSIHAIIAGAFDRAVEHEKMSQNGLRVQILALRDGLKIVACLPAAAGNVNEGRCVFAATTIAWDLLDEPRSNLRDAVDGCVISSERYSGHSKLQG